MNKQERIEAAEKTWNRHENQKALCYRNSEVDRIAIERFIEGAEAEAESKWVSVDERLPENRSYVLAYTTNGGYTSTCEYKHGCWFNGLDRLNFVTHWQPLPTPPLNNRNN